MSKKAKVPKISPEEQALMGSQKALLDAAAGILTNNTELNNLLQPILFEQAGLTPIKDDKGKITGFKQAKDPNAGKRAQIERGFLDRTLAAQKGKVPINPLLLRDLASQEKELRAQLADQLGPGYETSSPGIEALAQFNQRRSGIIDQAAREDLTYAEGLGIQRGNSNQTRIDALIQRALGINNASLPGAGVATGVAAGFGGAMQPYQLTRQQQFSANQQYAQSGGWGNALGSIAGTAIGAYATGGMSLAGGGGVSAFRSLFQGGGSGGFSNPSALGIA